MLIVASVGLASVAYAGVLKSVVVKVWVHHFLQDMVVQTAKNVLIAIANLNRVTTASLMHFVNLAMTVLIASVQILVIATSAVLITPA